MPTTRERLTITRVPRVDRIIREGQQKLPGAKPSEVLIDLAERGIETVRPRGTAGLMLLPADVTVNLAAAEAALLDD